MLHNDLSVTIPLLGGLGAPLLILKHKRNTKTN